MDQESSSTVRVRRHLFFVFLLVAYVTIVLLTGMNFGFFSKRSLTHVGMDIFTFWAWCACYWNGPRLDDATPATLRSSAILIGTLGMLGTLGWKMMLELF